MRLFNYIGLLLLTFFLCGCQQERFTIYGDLHQLHATRVYLVHENLVDRSLIILDSSEVHEGHFELKGSVKYPIACSIKIGTRTTLNLIVENSPIYITGSIRIPEEIKVRGSSSDDDYRNLLFQCEDVLSRKNKIWANMVKQNDAKPDFIETTEDSILSITHQFVKDNPQSIGAAFFVYYLYLDRNIEISKLAPIINSFDPSIAESEYIQYLKREIPLSIPLREGDKAPDFEIKSIRSDSIFSLKDFTGKYLYIYFTASWTKNFNTKKKEIKSLSDEVDIDILSVYLDLNKDKLLDKTKDVTWKQASSFDYWECLVSKTYCVNKIPYGVLIDKDGTIIAINPSDKQIKKLIK